MRFRAMAVLTLFLLSACGSGRGSSRPAGIPQPDINVGLTHEVFFGSQSEAPATIEVVVANRASVPITIRRVEVSSPGMVTHGLHSTQREFQEVVNPGASKAVTVFATAVTTTRRPNEPLTIRAIVFFESAGANWREVVMAR
ncbi:MAG TPA: hypothetical protein VGF48_04350 [Thermoanaerobaculia bacterium]|jgi:hypothetical protein